MENMHYNDVMVIIGFGKIHLRLLATCGLLLMFTVTETMGMAIIAPASACEFGITDKTKSVIQSAAFIGMILSSYIWGYCCDKIGRRAVLLRSTAMAIVCSFSSMLITNFWVFLTLRFMTGLCVAGPGFASLTYLGEFCTAKNRAPIINYMCMFNGVAMVYCPGLGQMLVHWKLYIPVIGNLAIRSWRVLGLLFSVPGWISFLSLLQLPESPKFLLMVHRFEECWEMLNWLCQLNKGKDLDAFGIKGIAPLLKSDIPTVPNLFRAMTGEVVPLFQNPYRKKFLTSCVVMFGLILVANGVAIWFTDIRNDSLVREEKNKYNNESAALTICETISNNRKEAEEQKECHDQILAFWDSILLGASFLAQYLIFGLMLLCLPRKPVFCTSLTISGLCGLCLSFMSHPHLTVCTFIIFLSIPAVIINLMSSAVLEFIPTYLRGKAMCICMMFGRSGAVVGITTMGMLINKSCYEAFFIFSFFPFSMYENASKNMIFPISTILIVCAVCGYFLPLDAHIF